MLKLIENTRHRKGCIYLVIIFQFKSVLIFKYKQT